MRSRVPQLLAAMLVASAATVSASAMSFHGSPGTTAARPFPPTANAFNGQPGHGVSSPSASAVRTGPVPLKAKKKAGKLNGACYRACVKTSMGDAFRTDQFCAYSCSLD